MEVETIIDDSGSAMGYLVKGHVSDEELVAAICEQTSYDTFEISCAKYVERGVYRKVPCSSHETWAFMYWPSEPGPGAFACTVAWLE